jgi:hypothetical protein
VAISTPGTNQRGPTASRSGSATRRTIVRAMKSETATATGQRGSIEACPPGAPSVSAVRGPYPGAGRASRGQSGSDPCSVRLAVPPTSGLRIGSTVQSVSLLDMFTPSARRHAASHSRSTPLSSGGAR